MNHELQTDLEKLGEQFPWFVPRMMTDSWTFGLLLRGNVVMVVECIDEIWEERGEIVWLDVQMATESGLDLSERVPPGLRLMFSPTERTRASVRGDAVIAAFELAEG